MRKYLWKADPRYCVTLDFDGGLGTTRHSTGTLAGFYVYRFMKPLQPASNGAAIAQKMNTLPPDDAFAFACSASLVLTNNGVHSEFAGYWNTAQDRAKYAGILRSSWGITTSEGLLQTVHDLASEGQNGSYRALANLISGSKGATIPEIIERESLSVLDGVRLFYVAGTIGRTGERGIEAWDLGRAITLLRWASGTGLITQETARAEIRPLIKRIRDSYVSWEDYTAHYLIGRGFFGLTSADTFELVSQVLEKLSTILSDMPFDTLAYNGKETRMGLSFDDVFYPPVAEARPWTLALYSSVYRNSRFTEQKAIAQDLLNEARSLRPRDIGIINAQCGILMGTGDYSGLERLVANSELYIQGKNPDAEEISNFLFYKIVVCVLTERWESALATRDTMTPNARQSPLVCYFTGFAYIRLHDAELDDTRKKELYANADECFREASRAGYETPQNVTSWLEANRTE